MLRNHVVAALVLALVISASAAMAQGGGKDGKKKGDRVDACIAKAEAGCQGTKGVKACVDAAIARCKESRGR
jgi:hypothetical protein